MGRSEAPLVIEIHSRRLVDRFTENNGRVCSEDQSLSGGCEEMHRVRLKDFTALLLSTISVTGRSLWVAR